MGTKELALGIQLERSKGGDMYSGKYFGFNSTEESIFTLFIMFVSQKIAELAQNETIKKREQLFESTHKFLTELLEQRTIKDFIIYVRRSLGNYLGYETCGLLYYSKQGNERNNIRECFVFMLR